eukprot:547394-Alexandrium_andersonii.AAC.1
MSPALGWPRRPPVCAAPPCGRLLGRWGPGARRTVPKASMGSFARAATDCCWRHSPGTAGSW